MGSGKGLLLPFYWQLNGVPQFYTGLIPLLLSVSLLFHRDVGKKLRTRIFAFAALLVMSSVLSPFMFVWCGFRQPTGFYCRIAIWLSFLEIGRQRTS